METGLVQRVTEHLADRSIIARFNGNRFDKGLRWGAERQYAIQIVSASEALQKCDPVTFQLAMLDVAYSGLSLNPRLGHGYLIPYKSVCRFQPGYRGLEHLTYRAGTVKSVQAVCVYPGDDFRVYTKDNRRFVEHVERDTKRKGNARAAYCIAQYTSGGEHVEVMYAEDLEAVERQAKSRPGGGVVWTGSWRSEMEKKAVIRRGSKHWPLDDGGRMEHLQAVMARADDDDKAPLSGPPDGKQELCVSPEQILTLHAFLTEHEIEPASADTWLQRTAEAMSYPSIEALPARRFSEAHDRLSARLDRVKKTREKSHGG